MRYKSYYERLGNVTCIPRSTENRWKNSDCTPEKCEDEEEIVGIQDKKHLDTELSSCGRTDDLSDVNEEFLHFEEHFSEDTSSDSYRAGNLSASEEEDSVSDGSHCESSSNSGVNDSEDDDDLGDYDEILLDVDDTLNQPLHESTETTQIEFNYIISPHLSKVSWRKRALKSGSCSEQKGFGMFQVELASNLSNDSVRKLATIFNFSPSKFDKVKRDSLAFVRVLKEEGIITPSDISSLINALQSINRGGIAKAVQESFERNQMREPGVPRALTSELKQKHSLLVSALKKEYRKRYSGVKPVPFLHDTWRCVNDIFVESKIEVLDNSKSKKDPTRWSSIKSRHEIFTERTFERHITIEGEPGFGKSTLLLQYASDWSTSSTESPLNNSYIFILLRLKDVTDTPNVYDAIKTMLPEDLPITHEDIKEIVTYGQWKVVLALDGYDEYSAMDNTSSDINKIIEGRILTTCIIIITTRPSCLPKLQSPTVTHCKLTGFDQGMQEEYIDKAIASQAASSGMKELIMGKLKENVVLSDICQVPLFFATFAHMNTIGAEYQKLNSVTSYFSFMLASFFGHLENKAKVFVNQFAEGNPIESSAYRLQIAKLAFDGLISKKQNLLWLQDDLLKLLSPSCYEQYISAGILLKEQKRTFKVVSGSHADNQIEVKTYVRFFHKTFQEYYAAHYIAHLAETQNADALHETLSKFDLYNYQYVMRFACGLKPKAAKQVQDYLTNLGKDGRVFSILCIMEQETGAVDSTIAQLCTEQVIFGLGQSRLLQRSTIHLLQRASQRKVSKTTVLIRYLK
ncbi:NLR family CARD domain-containing protein 4 [Holothuria leucospilota]|uniref:NLR family CARD domain-containing protein 4 n=1 Tax=Holothuria leucospilota TaxID=206669 RepID=A0A9Q1CSR3_HOLLE|nr:NLR family CARD domain-containing protein 4 [Holothuria leucospilota]